MRLDFQLAGFLRLDGSTERLDDSTELAEVCARRTLAEVFCLSAACCKSEKLWVDPGHKVSGFVFHGGEVPVS